MHKKLLSGIFWVILLNLLIKPFWVLGVDVGVQNVVGAETYGFYFAIFNFSFLFNILLDLGITNFNNRNISQNTHLLPKYFSALVSLKLVLGILFTVITFLIGCIIGYSSSQFYLLLWLCFNQFLNSFIIYLRSNLSAVFLFKTDSFLSVLDKFLMIIFCGILLWGNVVSTPFKIEWLVYTQTLAYVITAVVVFLLVAKQARFQKLTWDYPFFIAIMKQSLPFAILTLLMTFYNRVDSVMLERVLPDKVGEYQAGIYAGAYRILDSLNVLGYLISVPLLSVFSKMIKTKESIGNTTKMAFGLVFCISFPVVVYSFFYAKDLMALLYHDHLEDYTNIFRIIIFCFLPISVTYVFGTLLTANGSLKYLNTVALSGVVLNILLNIILIPQLKAVGAGFASITTQSVTALVQMGLAAYLFKIKIKRAYLWRFFAFVSVVILSVILLNYFGISWFIALCVVGILALVSAFALNLLSLKMLKPLGEGV